MRYISNNNLAKELNIDREKLFSKLKEHNLIGADNRLTKTGVKYSGEYKQYKGTEYISWKDKDKIITLLTNKKSFLDKIINTVSDKTKSKAQIKEKNIDPRKNYKAPEHRTDDGHYVRSKSEKIIDDWLYRNNIVHAYEKKLPIEENLLSDFYLPNCKVYIEFWGYETKTEYLKRKAIKQKIYKKYDLNLIELNDKEVQNLDDILPKMLLKFGIKLF